MRWDYVEPKGKLLVGDGNVLHMYNPNTNQVRPVRLEDSGDLRAPLSFLLGRLNFRRQFRNLRFETIEGVQTVIGDGRPGKDSYERVEFTYDPETFSLKRLRVIGTRRKPSPPSSLSPMRCGTYSSTRACSFLNRPPAPRYSNWEGTGEPVHL